MVVFLLEVGFQLPLAALHFENPIRHFEAGSVFVMVVGSTSSGLFLYVTNCYCYHLLRYLMLCYLCYLLLSPLQQA